MYINNEGLKKVVENYMVQLIKSFLDGISIVADIEKLTGAAAVKLLELAAVENVSIALKTGIDECLETFGSAGHDASGSKCGISVKDITAEDEIFSKGCLLRSEYSKDNALGRYIEGINAEIMIPLAYNNRTEGILSFGRKRSGDSFSAEEIDLLSTFAGALTGAIINSRLVEKNSQMRLQMAQREKMAVIGTLSAGINHEICNPLGIARGQSEMYLLSIEDGLYDKKTSAEVLEISKSVFGKVIFEIDRATAITKKLSAFAKPSRSKEERSVRVDKEIDEVISLIENEFKLDNVEIVRGECADIPGISADRKQVQEIFFNIIWNAAQSIEGEGCITIRIYPEREDVAIEVADTGKGIEKSDLSRIFDPFFTTKGPEKGTGLGLFIVKQIVEKNNGSIVIISEPEKGTKVKITFRKSG